MLAQQGSCGLSSMQSGIRGPLGTLFSCLPPHPKLTSASVYPQSHESCTCACTAGSVVRSCPVAGMPSFSKLPVPVSPMGRGMRELADFTLKLRKAGTPEYEGVDTSLEVSLE
jgi:hypothetical protein